MNKQSKWYKKQLELIDEQTRFDKKIIRQLTKNKDDVQDELIKLIESFVGRYKEDEMNLTTARKRINMSEANRYNKQLDKLVKTKDLSPQAKEELNRYRISQRSSRLTLLEADINKELVEMANYEQQVIDEAMHLQTQHEIDKQGALIIVALMGLRKLSKSQATKRFKKSVKTSGHVIESAIYERRWNTMWSENIWLDMKALRQELNIIIDKSLKTGGGSIDAARELRKKVGNTKFNTERLVRTEFGRIQIETQRYLYLSNDIKKYVVITEKDACDICLPFDGKVFNVSEMEQSVNAPIFHPQCRCSSASYFDREEWEQGMRDRGLYSDEEIKSHKDMTP